MSPDSTSRTVALYGVYFRCPSSARSRFHVARYDAVAFPARRHVDPFLRRAEMDGHDEEHDRQQHDAGGGEPDPWDGGPPHCIPVMLGSESADPQQIERGGQNEG